MITVDLCQVGLVHRSSADILRLYTGGCPNLVLNPQAPLHEIRRVQLTTWDRRNRNWWKTGCRIGHRRGARQLSLCKPGTKPVVGRNGGIHGAIGDPGSNRCSADGAEKTALKRSHVRRVSADGVRNAARQEIAEYSESASQQGIRAELPGDGCSWLKNGDRSGREQITKTSLNRGVQRLIDVVGDGSEGAVKTGNLVMRIVWIGVEGIAQTEVPGELGGHSPGILRIEIEI